MNGVRPANGLRTRLGQTEKAHFPSAHQLRHRANRLFNWRVWIDAMLVIEIDHIHAEPAQTCLACLAHVIRFAADPAVIRPVRVTQNSKFCCNADLLAMSS